MTPATPPQVAHLKRKWGIETPCSKDQATALITRLDELAAIGDDKALAERADVIAAAHRGATIEEVLAVPTRPRAPGEYFGLIVRLDVNQRESLSHKEQRTTRATVLHPATGEVLYATEPVRDTVNYLRKPKPGDRPPSYLLELQCHEWILANRHKYPTT